MQKSDWKKCKLGDVVNVKGGKRLPAGHVLVQNATDHPYLRVRDLTQRFPLKSNLEYIREDTFSHISRYIVKENDVVLSIVGSIGLVALINKNLNNISLTENAVRLFSTQVFPLFLYYYLLSPVGQAEIAKNTVGAVQAKLPIYGIQNIDILLPPVEEQKRIAQILGSLDDKIELLQKQNKTLEDMAKAIFKSWFVDFDVVHAKQKGIPKADIMREYHLTDELYGLFPSDFENSSLGPIPSGWQVKTLGDISTCYDSKRIPLSNRERAERQGNYPYYGATSIMDHVDDFLFDGIYLLLGEDGSVVKPEGTPFLQYVFGKIWVNNHAHVLQGKAPVGTEFLYLFLSDVQIQPYVTGAVQAKLNQKNMNSIPVCMATEDFVRQFQGIIEIYFVKIRSNLKQIQTLTELRDALLPRLISGKIRV